MEGTYLRLSVFRTTDRYGNPSFKLKPKIIECLERILNVCKYLQMIQETFDNLKALGIVTGNSFKDGKFTQNGTRLASIPLAPQLARLVLESPKFGVMSEICAIVSLTECEHIYAFTSEDKKRAALSKYVAPEGDLHTYYNLMKQFVKEKDKKQWCESLGLVYR